MSIVWYENSDGQGAFGREHAVAIDWYTQVLLTADLDGDGDQDVCSGAGGAPWGPPGHGEQLRAGV